MGDDYHKSVLLEEVVAYLQVKLGEWYLDCTLGDGGHSLEILKLGGKIFGVDVDSEALDRASKRFGSFGIKSDGYRLLQGNFRDLIELIRTDNANLKFEGAILDLGISSLQLQRPERGFSFQSLGPLDMRMDPTLQVRALDLIKGLNKGELYELFTKLGEEKYAKGIANAIISSRQVTENSIESTLDLANLIEKVVGGKKHKIHPATKVFQALRIAVNDELNSIKEVLPQLLKVIEKGGYILVISFHSLEDRIIKTTFNEWEQQGWGRVINKKPIVPGTEELGRNPRSRSAKLRVFKL